MDLETLNIKQLRELRADIDRILTPSPAPSPVGIPEHPYPVGKAVYVRTVTMHYTGMLVRVTAGELVLTDAAWIAESGRFSAALRTGVLDEVEPFPAGNVIVPRDGVIDVSEWRHALPAEVK